MNLVTASERSEGSAVAFAVALVLLRTAKTKRVPHPSRLWRRVGCTNSTSLFPLATKFIHPERPSLNCAELTQRNRPEGHPKVHTFSKNRTQRPQSKTQRPP